MKLLKPMSIQDIQALSDEIYEEVDQFISERDCYNSPKLKILRHDGQIDVSIIDTEEVIDTPDETTYNIERFICDDDEATFPNIDEINEIANEWIFLD